MLNITGIIANIATILFCLYVIYAMVKSIVITFIRWIHLANSKTFDILNEKSKLYKMGYKKAASVLFREYWDKVMGY